MLWLHSFPLSSSTITVGRSRKITSGTSGTPVGSWYSRMAVYSACSFVPIKNLVDLALKVRDRSVPCEDLLWSSIAKDLLEAPSNDYGFGVAEGAGNSNPTRRAAEEAASLGSSGMAPQCPRYSAFPRDTANSSSGESTSRFRPTSAK